MGELLSSTLNQATTFLKENPLVASGLAFTGGAVTGALTTAVASRVSRSPTRSAQGRRRRSRSHRHTHRHAKRKKHAHRHSHSSRKIRTTKNGQPYIILASGKARFIKKSSASSSRKRKGGYY